MHLNESQIFLIDIACPFGRAHDYLSNPENFPQWASGLGSGINRRDGRWIAHTPAGEAEIRFTDRNGFGVLDHTVMLPGGESVYVPMRIVRNGEGCQVMLTLFRPASYSDEKFNEDIEWVRRDLAALKAILEKS